ncbi:MFS transporter [Acinetobacter baumannii]
MADYLGVGGASIICALMIDKVGRRPWYSAAFFLAIIPLMSLSVLGAKSAMQVVILATLSYAILQTISFSLYLYAAELYPTRLRAMGIGFSTAWYAGLCDWTCYGRPRGWWLRHSYVFMC